MLSWPVFFIIPASPKPLTYHLLYCFIYYLTGPHATLAGSNLAGVNPSDLGPLESHICYGAVRSRNVIKPIYYIDGIVSFCLIDLGALTQFIDKTFLQ